MKHFREDLYVLVEYPYVDKIYRDSYYLYYSTKSQEHSRDCIRLSFFDKSLEISDFDDPNSFDHIETSYLGFIVLRPTFPQIIGRSIVSPNAVKNNKFRICSVKVDVTSNGLKTSVFGFPHASQDGETITCAETSILNVMEYFGLKYPEYSPILPSKIKFVVESQSFERTLPSVGLNLDQISYILREFGFGVKMYLLRKETIHPKTEFLKLLKVYVESGIPIIIGIKNNKGIQHAQCIIGRANISNKTVDSLVNWVDYGNNVKVYDFADLSVDYVFIDDNHPPYMLGSLEYPSSFYTNAGWTDCEIDSFIVPLHPKVYLSAENARTYAESLLKKYIAQLSILKNKEVVLKVFLTSSRSYKQYLTTNLTLEGFYRKVLLGLTMPKFIWIIQISTKEQIKTKYVEGVLILDTTESQGIYLIAGVIGNYFLSENVYEFVKIKVPLSPFKGYDDNLT